jgi:hypothetical protein
MFRFVPFDPDRRPKAPDTQSRRPFGLQHVAFADDGLDDLLGTYVRLEKLGIEPTFAADHGPGISVYDDDPDRNVVELDAYNYPDPRTAAERLGIAPPTRARVDFEKLAAARKAGASPWELHEPAISGEFASERLFEPRSMARGVRRAPSMRFETLVRNEYGRSANAQA